MSSRILDRWHRYVWPYAKYVGYELNLRWRVFVARVARRCSERSLRRRSHKLNCGRWRDLWRW